MRFFAHRLLLLTLALAVCMGAEAKKKKQEPMYLFGYGVALLDSTTYLSAVVRLDSATIDPKTKILNSIVRYSNQLRTYLEALYESHVTCTVFYDKSKAKLEKKYLKMRRRVNDDKSLKLKEIPADEFKFVWVPNEVEVKGEVVGEIAKDHSKKKKKKAPALVSESKEKQKSSNKGKRGTR